MLRTLRLMLAALLGTTAARRRRGPLLPSWSFAFEWVVAFMREDWRTLWRWPAPRIRERSDQLARPTAALRATGRRIVADAGIAGAWFEPRGARADALLFYLHGGSYQFGSTRAQGDLIARLAVAANARAFGLDYRLAPEHPFPAPLEDALRAWEWLLGQGFEPARIAVAGESAGGNLALELALSLRDAGRAMPGCLVAISPWIDLTGPGGESPRRNAEYDWGAVEMLHAQARTYAGPTPLTDPRVSPAFADLRGLPPMLLQFGEAEILHDDCAGFARKAREAAVEVEVDVLREMPHAAQFFADYSPEARRAIDHAAQFMRRRCIGA